ncbi:radical SAM/SPASM domain-containing protein [Magnetococcus sp. PR-3]|uniref:radical SAM/SPASM domain-containing protein n=1 Tax=Magnetococcus sp. PR-3 TaxID=3120355 RepID=UPI002FCE2A02
MQSLRHAYYEAHKFVTTVMASEDKLSAVSKYLERQKLVRHRQKVADLHDLYDGKVAIVDYPPKFVTLGINGKCTFKCQFCVSHSPDCGEDEVASHQYKMNYDMEWDDFKRIVDMCKEAGVPHVHVAAAGEPFLHKDILPMLDYIIELYGSVSIQTDFVPKLFDRKKFVDEILDRKQYVEYITTDIFPRNQHNAIKVGSDFDYLLDCMERICKESDISFRVHNILTRSCWEGLEDLLRELHGRGIKFNQEVVNLVPHNFNDFTAENNIYLEGDDHITEALQRLKALGDELGIEVTVPKPWDRMSTPGEESCMNFWNRFQVIPSKHLEKDRWRGNVIPSQCNAVVLGKLWTLGDIFEYDNLIDFWNNDIVVEYRKRVIEGQLPDPGCVKCYKYCHRDPNGPATQSGRTIPIELNQG